MTVAIPTLRLAPITSGLGPCNPRVLLGGRHQPRLLRYLDGWSKDHAGRNLRIQFVDAEKGLSAYAADSFDMAVIEAPSQALLEDVLGQLTRVARRGLITYR